MQVSSKTMNVLWRIAAAAAVCFTIASLAGCHSTPPRPKETPQFQDLRKAKRGD